MTKFVVGVDVDSKACQICVKEVSSKKTLLNIKVANLELQEFIEKRLKELAVPSESMVVMESTGKSYFLFPMHVFSSFGYQVRVENPRFIKAFADSFSVRGKKTDRYDAEVLALYGIERCIGSYKVSYLPNDLKATVRHWAKLRKVKQEIEGYAFSQALVVFPLIDEVFGGSPLKTKLGRFALSYYEGWHNLYERDFQTFKEEVYSHIRRARNTDKFLDLLYRYAEKIAKTGYKPTSRQVELLRLALRELEEYEKLIRLVEEELIRIGRGIEEVELLKSIPGIGDLSAVVLYAEIGNIDRFRDRDDLWAYFGMDPRNEESGESVRRSSKISRAGVSYVRGLLYMIACSLIRKGAPYFETYWQLRKKGKSHKEALIVIAHKIVRIIYGVLKGRFPCRKFAGHISKSVVDFDELSYEVQEDE